VSERPDVFLLTHFSTQSTAVLPVHVVFSWHTHTWSSLLFITFYMTTTDSCDLTPNFSVDEVWLFRVLFFWGDGEG